MIAHPSHLARNTDPITSREAAANVSVDHRDREVAAMVLEVLADGVSRTDEEIAAAVQARNGGKPTAGRIRHGRLHLSKLEMVVEDGRKTLASGATGRAWRKA